MVVWVGFALAGCASSSPTAQPVVRGPVSFEPGAVVGSRPPTRGPQRGPNFEHHVQLNLVDGLLHGTPIFNGDFADPAIVNVGALTYVYASDTTTAHIPVLEVGRRANSPSVYLGDALPTLPSWTEPGFQWGPAVWQRPDGTYVLYYSTPNSAPSQACLGAAQRGVGSKIGCDLAWSKTARQCISAATSTNPAGPFVDHSSAAFVCPLGQGGAIDPSIFVTPAGQPYLIWKTDGDCCNLPTVIYSQPLSPDGLETDGPAHALVSATQAWEGDLVEGPAMISYRGVYWLFYSANNWDSADYAVGVAKCSSVIGPCSKPLDHAWLSSSTPGQSEDQGPGGPEFADIDGTIWMVHHGWLPGQAGTPDGQRRLYVNLIEFPNGVPAIAPAPVAAALADLQYTYDNSDIPASATLPSAFADLVTASGGSLTPLPPSRLLADSQSACAELAAHQPWPSIDDDLTKRGLSTFEADVVAGFAAQRECPQYGLTAIAELQDELAPRTGRGGQTG